MIKKIYRHKRTRTFISDSVYTSYKQQMHLAVQESDSDAARQLRSAAKRYLRVEKNKAWKEFINKTANERQHFKLANCIYMKDFIKIKTKKFNFTDSGMKKPTLNINLD